MSKKKKIIPELRFPEFLNQGDWEYLYGDKLFLKHWVEIVVEAESNTKYLDWIQSIQEDGLCCGWLDETSVEENPSYLECDITNEINCFEWVSENIDQYFSYIGILSVLFGTVGLILVISTFALICRLKEFYATTKPDFGDYVHIPNGGKMRNVRDLTEG